MSTRSPKAADPLMEQFLLESREQLQRASDGLLELERDPGNDERVDAIFRDVHTVKGSTGLFDLPALTRLIHAGEQLLQAMKAGHLAVDGEVIDLALGMVDCILSWLDSLEASGELPAEAEQQGGEITARIEERIEGVASPATGSAGESASGGSAVARVADEAGETGLCRPPESLEGFSSGALRQLFRECVEAGMRLPLLVTYRPDEEAFFQGEDPLDRVSGIPELRSLAVEAPEDWGEPESFDTYRCQLAFHALCLSDRESVAQCLSGISGRFESHQLSPAALMRLQGQSGGAAVAGDLLSEVREALAVGDDARLERVIATGRELLGEELVLRDGLEWLALLQSVGGVPAEWSQELVAALAEDRQPDFTGLGGNVGHDAGSPEADEADVDAAGGLFAEDGADAADAGGGLFEDPAPVSLGETSQQGEEAESEAWGLFDDAPGAPSTEQQPADEPAPRQTQEQAPSKASGQAAAALTAGRGNDSGRGRSGARRQSHAQVRLDQLDRLGELVGELVVARNGMPHLARQAEKEHENRAMAREIKAQGALLERVTRELQRAVSDVQMQPVSTTFQRYRRMVRDLARKLDKDVALFLEGEDTEADRDVIEALVDPLTHLVRNSLDHGIESPEERRAAGKPEQGSLRLRARYTGDWLNIDVEDDGRGLDAEAIGRKAVDKGILDSEALEELDEHQRRRLIFAPGFSTAASVSDVSGRGVGMDAVHNTVADLGGRLELDSEPGQGTRITLVLPLSMAVNKVMEVDVAGHPIGVPVTSVVEISRVAVDEIQILRDQRAVVLRDQVIPVVGLHQALGIESDGSQDSVTLVVVRHGERLLALEVDRVLEDRDVVVKPLEGILAGNPAFSGSALLGDGRILLILNLRGVIA